MSNDGKGPSSSMLPVYRKVLGPSSFLKLEIASRAAAKALVVFTASCSSKTSVEMSKESAGSVG